MTAFPPSPFPRKGVTQVRGLRPLHLLAVPPFGTARRRNAMSETFLVFTVIGDGRIGIVREASQVPARHAVSVEKLETHAASAPMSAEMP